MNDCAGSGPCFEYLREAFSQFRGMSANLRRTTRARTFPPDVSSLDIGAFHVAPLNPRYTQPASAPKM